MNKITILGSGTSTGVPILGCKCKVCQSSEVRNKRFRTSALIHTHQNKKILLDASPDLRTQLLNNQVDGLDGVIITHDHADHTHGMDDLRPLSKGDSPLPVYMDATAARDLKRKFPYIFDTNNYFQDKPILGGGIPRLESIIIQAGPEKIVNENFTFLSLPHGHENTLGIIHQRMGYIVDCREIPEESLTKLCDAKLEILIIDCLRPNPHQTHLHLDLTLEYIDQIKPRIALLTHLGHEWDYLDLLHQLQMRGVKNTFPALDGQSFLYSNE